MKVLRPYQEKTVDILAGGGLNASGLGAGKTLTSVEACRLLHLGRLPRVLVVAPPTTLRQWERTFVEQFPSLAAKDLIHVVGTHVTDTDNWALMTKRRPGVYIIGWNAMHGGIPEETRRKTAKGMNAVRKEPKATIAAAKKAMQTGTVPPWTRTGTWDLMILDEVHRAVNRSGVPRQVLKCIKADRKLGLSATPGGNKPEGLWTILNLLWPDRYSSFWDWVGQHFEILENEVYKGGEKSTFQKIGPEKKPGGVWRNIPAVVRYRTEDVVAELPPVIERVVQVPLKSKQEEQYRDFEEQSLAWLGDFPVAAQIPLEQRIRLRQAALGTLQAEEAVQHIDYRLNRPQQEVMRAWQTYLDSREGAAQDGSVAILDEQPSAMTLLCVAQIVADFFAAHCANMSAEERRREEARFEQALGKQVKLDQGIESEDIVLDALDISYDENEPQPKLDAVCDILADLPDDEPVLIWTHSAKWARMAEKRLGSKAASWTLKTTAVKRKKIEAGFGTEYRVLIAQLQSLSEGVDWLKDVCRCEIIASPSEDNVMNEQAEGRLHRPGQTSPVQRWRLVSENTIDDDVDLKNLAKRATMASLYQDKKECVAA